VEKRKVNDQFVKLICSSFTVNEQWLRMGKGDIFASANDEMFIKLAGFFREFGPKYRCLIKQPGTVSTGKNRYFWKKKANLPIIKA
jgi:hypothetical protein